MSRGCRRLLTFCRQKYLSVLHIAPKGIGHVARQDKYMLSIVSVQVKAKSGI